MENREIEFPSGKLTVEELKQILNYLPVDISFVDANDEVKYFNEPPERIFSRPRSTLGRKVQNCHPPKSIHIVERILADFKSGQQKRVSFWLEIEGKFVHIEYIAVHNEKGEYLGTLEVTQDLTEKRKITGQKRILQY